MIKIDFDNLMAIDATNRDGGVKLLAFVDEAQVEIEITADVMHHVLQCIELAQAGR